MLLPRRVVQNVKSHLIYTIALIVIVIVGLPFIQTLFSVLWKGNVVLSSIAIFILVGLFYALPEKSRLDRDGEQMRQFRKDVPDGTYRRNFSATALRSYVLCWLSLSFL